MTTMNTNTRRFGKRALAGFGMNRTGLDMGRIDGRTVVIRMFGTS